MKDRWNQRMHNLHRYNQASREHLLLYLPDTGSLALLSSREVRHFLHPGKVPVIAGEEGICEGCGVATLSINYYDLGVATGKMALKVLVDGEDISKMPIEYAP